MEGMSLEAISTGLKYVGIGLAILPLGGIGAGIAKLFATLVSEVSRNPGAKGQLFTYTLIGFALTEATALYALVIAFILLFS